MNFFTRWLITAAAVAVAVLIVPGISIGDGSAWVAVLVTAAILALLNVLIKPLLKFLSCGLLIVTLGLFSLVINAGLLYFAAWISNTAFSLPFIINGFWPAFWGGLVVSLVTIILSAFFEQKRSDY